MPKMLTEKKPLPLIPYTKIAEKKMEWLWFPYIPARDATMIAGPGGIGKSHIAVDIAARASRGDPFPFTEGVQVAPRKVLLLSAEDDPNYVMKGRLRRAGADMANVFAPPMFFTVDAEGLKTIEYYIKTTDLGLVFIDPVVAYVGTKVDINKANEVRGFVGGLQKIAGKYGIPILYVHHNRKGAEGSDSDRAMGSADFVNGSRSTLSVTKASNGDKIMVHAKTNYAALGPTLSFAFGEDGFEWTGVYEEDGTRAAGGRRRSQAGEWLRARLSAGPVAAVTIEKEAQDQGFNHRTLVRAKAGMAESQLVMVDGKKRWYWKLIGDASDKADVPVMGGKWAPENDRTDREIIARTEERVREAAPEVAERGSDDIDDLMDKVLG